jgi:ribosomal protein S18 acetylase RimI-like enzyme
MAMGEAVIPADVAAVRAKNWRNGGQAAVCDSIVPWDYGTVVRTGRFPTYYDFNVMRVEQQLELDVPELAACADEALAGLAHRRIDFDRVTEAEARRADFERAGWKATRLAWMLHQEPLPRLDAGVPVEEVPYDETAEMRLRWHLEDHPELEFEGFKAGAREIAAKRGARVLAVRERGLLVAFAELQWRDASAEVTSVYVDPEHRGRGLGTALTMAAVEAAAGAHELWIVADDEDRPKELYGRLGFRSAWVAEEFLLLP